jgi:hypothetical protein
MAYQSPQGLASLGRNGDSMLVHMSPSEVAGLQGLAMAQGGSLTINPETGLPEAFSLKGMFKSFLPTIAGGLASMIPGMQFASYPMLTGILAGAATGALTNKNKLLGAVTGGLGGYSGAGIMNAAKAAGATIPGATNAANTSTAVGGGSSGLATGGGYIPGATSGADLAYNNALLSSQGAGITNSAMSGASGAMDVDKLLAAGKPIGMANTFTNTASIAPDPTFMGNISQAGRGALGAATGNQAAIDAYTTGIGAKTAMGALGKTALPIAGAALGGIEESDIYGKPINMGSAKENEKYDPYKSLNLSGDTGLRLVAEGGYIDGYATGGTIQSGGIRDLYGTPDNQPTISPGLSGFGLGRLNNLAGEQALNQAQTLGYAMGGPVSFADGGDSTKQTLELPSLDTDAGPTTKVMNLGNIGFGQGLVRNLAENMRSAVVQGEIPDQTNDSLITKVATNLKTDPNYKPTNPLEEAIVNQLRGSNTMQGTNTSTQGLGSLKPSQPMTPTYNASQAMTPTYYAGMNAPKGYAEGGETSMNLDELPTLNVETGKQSYNTIQSALANSDNPQGRLLNKLFSFRPGGGQNIYDQFAAKGLKRLNNSQMAKGGYLNGQGDGMSDSIPATIEGKQPARLADGEFVVPADVVSHLGNGSSKAGSKKLYAMMDKIRHARTGTKKQGKQINADKYLPKVA